MLLLGKLTHLTEQASTVREEIITWHIVIIIQEMCLTLANYVVKLVLLGSFEHRNVY